MITEEYDKLLNKYHVVLAKLQDLQEQLNTKEAQWEKRDEDFQIFEKLTRELCEDILSKDPDEMVLGKDYSWSSISLNEILRKSKTVFRDYNADRVKFMRQIMDVSQQRLEKIESLKDQISQMKTNPRMISLTDEELKKQIETEKKQSPLPQKQLPIIIEEDDDEEPDICQRLANETHALSRTLQTSKNAPKITRTKKQIEKKRKQREEYIATHEVSLSEYKEKMSKQDEKTLHIIGTYGFNRYSLIEKKMLEENDKIAKNKIRICCESLGYMGLALKEIVNTPFGTNSIYTLTDMGRRVYKMLFNQEAIIGEADVLKAEHSNLEHGYGIRLTKEMLIEKGCFKEVIDETRKTPIILPGDIQYIPDIVAYYGKEDIMYIEYECANHTEKDIEAKLNKMTQVSPVLNFIVPNKESANKMCTQIENWIHHRGQTSLNNVLVRIACATQIRNRDLLQNDEWKYVYHIKKSDKPIVNY